MATLVQWLARLVQTQRPVVGGSKERWCRSDTEQENSQLTYIQSVSDGEVDGKELVRTRNARSLLAGEKEKSPPS